MSDLKSKAEALRKSKAEEFSSACPSRVIEMALEDLEAVEKNALYSVDMNFYHEWAPDAELCYVCLAGSVMANRLGAKHDDPCISTGSFPCSQTRLRALDCFRDGEVDFGLWNMGTVKPVTDFHVIPTDFHVTPYEDNPTKFKADMRAMAEMLKQAGL